jgi:hypothetical protein
MENYKEFLRNEVNKMRETDAHPREGSVANLLGIDRPVSWLEKNVFPQCGEVWDTHKEVFETLITSIFVCEEGRDIIELIAAVGRINILWSLCNNMYMLGYSKCLDEIERDRAILNNLEE